MRPQQPKLKFSDKDFQAESSEDMLPGTTTSKKKATAFTMLFGKSKWRKLKKQFAQQRVPDKLPHSPDEIKDMSDEEYAKAREEIKESQSLPSKDEPVFGEVHAPDLQMKGLEGQRMFIEAFGYDRYFKAMGMDPSLNAESYHEVLGREYKPYRTHVMETKAQTRARAKDQKENGIQPIDPEEVG